MKDKCVMKGCTRKIYVKKHQLCLTHAQRYYRKGNPGKSKIREWRKTDPYIPNNFNK